MKDKVLKVLYVIVGIFYYIIHLLAILFIFLFGSVRQGWSINTYLFVISNFAVNLSVPFLTHKKGNSV